MGLFDKLTSLVSKKIVDEITKEVKITVKESIEENIKANEELKEDFTTNTLYINLKEYRWKKSQEEKVKPYYVYNNETLELLVKIKPKSIEELKKIKGFGTVKSEKYGEDILNIIEEN